MQIDHTLSLISLKNVSFSYDGNEKVVENVSYDVHKGDYIGLIGPNGGGKTTTLKLMLGLLIPTKGQVMLFDTPIEKFHQWEKIGYVSQRVMFQDKQFPATVEEVVLMGRVSRRGLFRRFTKDDYKQAGEVLRKVDMLSFKSRQITQLSGGQLQRVLIARALASEPEILFLDEPTGGIDIASQKQFYALLRKLNQEFNVTLVMVSHDLDAIKHEVTEVVYINQTVQFYGLAKDYLKKLKEGEK
jgi:zinc transport system ATP-binding protein